jgi:three-Cys-motif partner protein
MGKILETVWDLEPHTAKKHEILRRYFQAWLPVLAHTNGRVLYIDGFAGPGEYKKGEDGSPAIVLKAARDHRHKLTSELYCLFVEAKQDRYEHLRAVLAAITPPVPGNIKFKPVHGTFNEHMLQMLNRAAEQKKRLAPTLAFIDPFGWAHTPFSTIASLMKHSKCEVLINFMYEEINRFLSLPNHAATFDELFGTPDWRAAVKLSTPDARERAIHDLYLKQLKTIAKFVRSFQMINMGNRVDYFLFFATNNLLGLERMKESMWKVDPTGEFQFSDFTDVSTQFSLFAAAPDYDALRKMITGRFRGEEVEIKHLGNWVVADTPFLRTHIKIPVLIPMEKEGAVSVVKAKPTRRPYTYPDGTILKFR